MGFRVDGVNGACHHAYDSPEVICFRDVADDAHASYWYEWQGISQDISVEQFFEEVEKCGLSREKLSAVPVLRRKGGDHGPPGVEARRRRGIRRLVRKLSYEHGIDQRDIFLKL